MSVVIVDYGSGNLHSAEKAFARTAAERGMSVVVSSDPEAVRASDYVVLPGVGAFGDCADGLAAVKGMTEALHEHVVTKAKPFFGICVGMQLRAETGRERGDNKGLGWIKGDVRALSPDDPALKIPHMGWNAFRSLAEHPVLDGLSNGDFAYYVHSYHMIPSDSQHALGTCDYGGAVTAIVGRDNMFGTQFHPEKSQRVGLRLIANWLEWRP